MSKRRAMNPSIPSETPAITNSTKAAGQRPCRIITITRGTMIRRPMVMMLGMVMGLGSGAQLMRSGPGLRGSCFGSLGILLPPGDRMRPMTDPKASGLTYAQAGVDIDAGNAMVEE